MNTYTRIALVAAAATLLGASCSVGNNQGTGRLTLSVTDAPVDSAQQVNVVFTGVTLKSGSEEIQIQLNTPKSIDLLAQSGGASAVLIDDVEIPAGNYQWIRLEVQSAANDADITKSHIVLDDNSKHGLVVPSGEQSGLKLVSGFTVGAGSTADFTIDFDLRKAVKNPQGQGGSYTLRPALRLVNNLFVGEIAGTVTPGTCPVNSTPAIYVYLGAITPDDMDGDLGDPLTTTLVEANGSYMVAFLPVGSYTVALTCDGASDNPDASDAITFPLVKSASVAAGQTALLNF